MFSEVRVVDLKCVVSCNCYRSEPICCEESQSDMKSEKVNRDEIIIVLREISPHIPNRCNLSVKCVYYKL
ncbi:hypothetical protein WN48_05457 [Eufriesea mexicana]|nr:hypothetical protein WN48_05457 [Eufriesea mexicana]